MIRRARLFAGVVLAGLLTLDASVQAAPDPSATPEPAAPAAASPAPSAVPAPPAAVASPTGIASPAPSPAAPNPAASSAAPPAAAASPAPVAPAAATTPTATPNPYHYVLVPPQPAGTADGGPQIVEIALNERTIEVPGLVLVRVTTSPNVWAVTARAFGRQLGIPQIAPGIFGGVDQLPSLPGFLLGRSYDIEIVASTQHGRSTSFTLPLGLR